MAKHKKIKLLNLEVLRFGIYDTLCNQENYDYLEVQGIFKRIEIITGSKTQGIY
jgi:hypothetical protein